MKLINQAAYSKAVYQVFNDFLEMAAISISNQVDFTHREEREKRYLDLINAYEKKQQALFPEMLAYLVAALEEKTHTTGPEDVLGPIFHELELHNKYKGQFFTPQSISDFMALAACSDLHSFIETQSFINMCEPCCGSGVMVTSFAKAVQQAGLNYCTQICVTAEDIDLKCVHMTYLQLALYGIPAVVIHGNSLTLEEWSRWYTPVYILNDWVWREHCGLTTKPCIEDELLKRASQPLYAAFRQVEALLPDRVPPAETPPAATASATIGAPADQEQLQLGVELDVSLVPAKTMGLKTRRPPLTIKNTEQLSLF